ncbi:hypothetical protein EUGRSUZ_H03873 [Eucalyptus grandis]|uniref:Uncharacterized protein n=2 Tax=Eucalyptus grandis TaxID=71139 RepID=A0ACC3JVX7_EUCGR|nr:hypothetical protein EUGRSUZ_H03873 [Eucalyptus grandis]
MNIYIFWFWMMEFTLGTEFTSNGRTLFFTPPYNHGCGSVSMRVKSSSKENYNLKLQFKYRPDERGNHINLAVQDYWNQHHA